MRLGEGVKGECFGSVTEKEGETAGEGVEMLKDEPVVDASWRRPAMEAQWKVLEEFTSCEWRSATVKLSGGRFMNMVTAGATNQAPLVVLHGFGTALGFWARNMDPLAAQYRVYLLDWMGCGASARPKFALGCSAEESEDFFVEALHEWREEVKKVEGPGSALESPFSILAHSLGGYLSVCFSERYPEAVQSLVLASPVGIPAAPPSIYPAPDAPLRKRLLFSLVFYLWGLNFTPQWFVRYAGSYLGRILAGNFVRSRFSYCTDEQQELLAEYMYAISTPPASGEYAINHILEPGAWARRPLVSRLPKLDIPVTFVYGDKDWMSWRHADDVRKTMKAATCVHIVEGAGHHLYMEKATEFNRIVLYSLKGQFMSS